MDVCVCVCVGHVSRLWNDAIPVVKIVKGHIGNEEDERQKILHLKNRGWIGRDF